MRINLLSRKSFSALPALLAVAGLLLAGHLLAQERAAAASQPRERLLMDSNWKFAFGNAADQKADFDFGQHMGYLAKQSLGNPAVCGLGFDDSKWKTVDLPHDWGMDLPFEEKAEGAWGSKPLGRQFPGTSVGWYRKTFALPATDKGRRVSVEFEGVCHDCTVEVNGFFVGAHFSGYTSFDFDITDFLRYGENNVLVVRVDASANEGWWYQGAGIYRHVWLTKTSPVHVPLWGTQVLTDTQPTLARVTTNAEVVNDSPQPVDVVVRSSVLDASGKTVGASSGPALHLDPWARRPATSLIDVQDPQRWSCETPTLYRSVTVLEVAGAEVDRYETPFGIRAIRFDPDQGFFLNEARVAIKGFCDHEQHAIVGTAVPDSIWAWRLQELKQKLGGNAIRMSHNPPAPALLDACDRLGILVMDETRLFSSGEEGLRQVDSLARRDRNHPSVIIWSAGNEEWALQSSPASEPVMTKLQQAFHRLDPSRLVTFAASNGGDLTGVNAVADVRGINYLDVFKEKFQPSAYHEARPRQPVIGTEDGTGDRPIKFMQDNPWYSGEFVWTGFAYYGESKWPNIIGPFGVLDICGFPTQPSYDRFQKAWAGKNDGDPAGGATPTAIRLDPDRATLNANGADTLIVNMMIVDGQDKRVGDARNVVEVKITGPGRILGVANGDPQDHVSDKGASHAAYQGRAQVLVQATHQAGIVNLEAGSEGLQSSLLQVETKMGNGPPSVP